MRASSSSISFGCTHERVPKRAAKRKSPNSWPKPRGAPWTGATTDATKWACSWRWRLFLAIASMRILRFLGLRPNERFSAILNSSLRIGRVYDSALDYLGVTAGDECEHLVRAMLRIRSYDLADIPI